MLKRLKERQGKLTKRIKHAEQMLDRLKREIVTLHEELPLLKRLGQEILENDMEKLNKDKLDKLNQYVELKKSTSPKHLTDEDDQILGGSERSVDGLARGEAGFYGCSFSFWG